MGYTLTIGELVTEYDNSEDYPHIRLSADVMSHENAPAFGEPTDRESQRWPSYTVWHDFCVFTGLYELFYGSIAPQGEMTRDDYLLQDHPGAAPLTKKHMLEINYALEVLKRNYPNAVPVFGEDAPQENCHLARLIWLDYWVTYAVTNLKQPTLANS